MNSRSGDRVPAGVSGEVGRGTVGTVAPTAPTDGGALALAIFSRVVYVVAAVYAAFGVALVWLAIMLAPWGLLIVIPATGVLGAAALLAAVGFGLSCLGDDESLSTNEAAA